MKIVALLALVLVAVSATSILEKYPVNFTQKRSIMTLLTQVESKLKAGGPMDAITKILGDFKSEIVEEQVQHDELFARQQSECASEFEYREQEVQAAVAAFKEATETLDGCQSQKVRASRDLATTKSQLSEARNSLAVAIDTRRREAYAFQTASEVFTMANRAVDEALVILEEIWSGESTFAQLNRHVNGLLKTAVKIRKAHLMGGIMSAMAQLGSSEVQADEELLNRVKNLLTNFKDNLVEKFNNSSQAEQAAIEEFKSEKARLEGMVSQLEAQEEGLKAEIAALNKCIVVQSSIVSDASAKRDRNQRIWDDAKALCEAVEDEYHTSTEARQEEQELLAAITERVKARFSEVSSGVTKRGETDAEDFEYNNKTEYDDTGFVYSGNK